MNLIKILSRSYLLQDSQKLVMALAFSCIGEARRKEQT